MKCKICDAPATYFAKSLVLNEHLVNYFECPKCQFVQTETPYWLTQAYSAAIAGTDVGLVYRNNLYAPIVANILHHLYPGSARFLDYGGGYGLFVRMMRDRGFDFDWEDKYCQNLFAQEFECDPSIYQSYSLLTSFEVFEHLVEPRAEIERMLALAPEILFSTELMPSHRPKPGEWWYYALETGQHISFFNETTLRYLAKEYGLNFYTNGSALHLLTPRKLSSSTFFDLCQVESPKLHRPSLLSSDYQLLKNKLIASSISKHQDLLLANNHKITPIVVVDGVFFQLYSTGIARVWKSLLEEWVNTEFGTHLVVLDRAGTAPKVEGISYYQIPAYDYNKTDTDRQMLQQTCNDLKADLFISTYYTTPLETPSVFMGYDMIPEMLGADLSQPMWQEKQHAIEHASAYLTISKHTAKDLLKVYPDISPDIVTVAHCGTQAVFTTQSTESIDVFRNKYEINKPYFILIGSSFGGYKNGILFWQGFSQLTNTGEFDLICTGSAGSNAEELQQYAPDSNIHHLRLDDRELSIAYAGAIALVYPSKYEGFGLPIAEAFAAGCPVITCPNASIPEVAGEAAIYVFDDDIDGMTKALREVQKPPIRADLIAAGLEQVKQFSWAKMGDIVSSVLIEQTLSHLSLGQDNLIIFPDWLQDEEILGEEICNVCYNLAQSSKFNRLTLLIDTTNVEDLEAANMLIAGISINLMMSTDIDITEHVEIALMGKLAPIQWRSLLPKLQGRIKLELESMDAIESAGANLISEIELIEVPSLALV